jgi:type IV pilus assembly protein PilA
MADRVRKEHMHRLATVILLLAGTGASQTAAPLAKPAPPQTARQALLEMFLADTPGAFEKHLSKATQAFLKTDSGVLPLQNMSEISGAIRQPGRQLETFDDGPILVRSEDPRMEQTVEVLLEGEADGGDEDELRLAVRIDRAGKPLPLPFFPTVTCTMKTESGIWRLHEVVVSLRVPLGDPDFLKTLTQSLAPSHMGVLESSALSGLRTLTTAEVSYASAFPELGFTCTLSDLGGAGDGETSSHAASMISDAVASGAIGGYSFAITDCSGSPVDHFRVAAAPLNPEGGLRAFCSDESAVIRFSDDGQAATCLRDGEPLP